MAYQKNITFNRKDADIVEYLSHFSSPTAYIKDLIRDDMYHKHKSIPQETKQEASLQQSINSLFD